MKFNFSFNEFLKAAEKLWHEDGDCFNWEGRLSGAGKTPYLRVNRADYPVRRTLFILGKKNINKSRRVVMTCGNSLCVNIEHMEDMTRKNAAKIASKKRNRIEMRAQGLEQVKRQNWCKLSDDQRTEIWMDQTTPAKVLADQYGVSRSWINKLRNEPCPKSQAEQAASVFNPFYLLAA